MRQKRGGLGQTRCRPAMRARYLCNRIFGKGRADWLPARDDDREGQEQTLAAAKACRFGRSSLGQFQVRTS